VGDLPRFEDMKMSIGLRPWSGSNSSVAGESSEEALKREILKNIPSVDQVVAHLKHEQRTALGVKSKKSELFNDSPPPRTAFKVRRCRRKSKVELRLDRIRSIRQDLQRIDVKNPTSVNLIASKPAFNLKLNLDIEKLRDQRVERLRQTARSITGDDGSSARYRRIIEPYNPRKLIRPRSSTRFEQVKYKKAASPFKRPHNSAKLARQIEKPPLSNRSDKTQLITRHFIDAGIPIITDDNDADKVVSKFLKMENAVSERVSCIPRDEPKKLKFAILPADLQYHIFCFLSCRQLTICLRVCKAFKRLLFDAMRTIFHTEFGDWPTRTSKKTLLWVLRRLHDMDSKRAAELLFWSAARGYTKFITRVVAGRDIPAMRESINVTSKNDNMTALHIACRHKQLEVLQQLLCVEDLNVNKLTKSGKHAVIFCIEQNSPEVLDILLTRSDLKVNSIDPAGVSLLYRACTGGNLEIVDALLMSSADPNIRDKELRTALWGACEAGHAAIVSSLLQHPKVDMELTSKSGKSPVFIASEKGHAEVVRLLLHAGASPRIETCRKKIALYVAAELGWEDVCRELLPYTTQEDLVRVTHFGTTPLFLAMKHSNSRIKDMFESFRKTKLDVGAKEAKTQRHRIPGTTVHVAPSNVSKEKLPEEKKQAKPDSQAKGTWKDPLTEALMQKATKFFQEEYENEFTQKQTPSQSRDDKNSWSVSSSTEHPIRITAEQARRFQQKQRNRIMSAKKRVNAKILAEQKQLVVQKEMIKCIRGRARVAALRAAARSTKALSSGSSTTTSSASEEIDQRVIERKPSVRKIVIMPKLHQTIMASLLKSRDAIESPARVRYFRSARAKKKDLALASKKRVRPMTQPTSSFGTLEASDWRQLYIHGLLTNQQKQHFHRKEIANKRKPPLKFGRVKNASDYIANRSKNKKRVVQSFEKRLQLKQDPHLDKQSETDTPEDLVLRCKPNRQSVKVQENCDRRKKEPVKEVLDGSELSKTVVKRKKLISAPQQRTYNKKKRLQSAYGVSKGKCETHTRKRSHKRGAVSARGADPKR